MSEKRFIVVDHSTCVFDKITKEEYVCIDREEALLVCKRLNEQQSIITSLEDENLYRNFELKSVDDLKKLKDIFEICMLLIDDAVVNEDLELGYESVFQFERRIRKFNGD